MSGMTFQAMQEAADCDDAIAARVRLCQYRVKEELFDCERDPDALKNLAEEAAYQEIKADFRAKMRDYMQSTGDELLPCFLKEIPLDRPIS